MDINQAHAFARKLIGYQARRIVAGSPGGSIVGIHFSEVGRNDGGQIHLGLWCTWRLEQQSRVLTCSSDDNAQGGPMLAGLDQLMGAVVRSVDIGTPAFDLSLGLDPHLRLLAFADSLDEDSPCWVISDQQQHGFSVKPAGRFSPAPNGLAVAR